MLRLILPITVCLSAGLTLIGGLIAHEWGWDEYASDDLYLIYAQTVNITRRYFIVDAAGNDTGKPLTWDDGTIIDLDCSPDGRLLAFFTNAAHLYVVDERGIVYDRDIDPAYVTFTPGLSIANDGTAALFERGKPGLIVDARGVAPLMPPQADRTYYNVQNSSHDRAIWYAGMPDGSQVYAPSSGQMIRAAPGIVSQGWLASEHIFAFTYPTQASAGTFLMDADRQAVFHLTGRRYAVTFSPDGRQAAGWFAADTLIAYAQVIVFDALSPVAAKQVTDEQNVSSLPICFLAFRPEVVINYS